MKSQSQSILEHLQKYKEITPLEALNKYGCFRLGARIFDLRDKGHKIKTQVVRVKTKHGESDIAKYILQ